MHLTLSSSKNFSRVAARLLRRRDWHPLVGLLGLYLIASAIAPAYGI
ncbi:hypothetical protein AB4851_20675 [Burkholderia sp. 22PA0099]